MFDLDHFTHVNDTNGHLVGDQVLVEIATRLADEPTAGCAVTISVGVAIGTADETPSVLYRSADNALYAAKAAGRNTVISAPDEAAVGDFQVFSPEK